MYPIGNKSCSEHNLQTISVMLKLKETIIETLDIHIKQTMDPPTLGLDLELEQAIK